MRRSKGTIYLEPRARFDAALIDVENIIYCYYLIIDILMDLHNCEYIEAVDYYCFNLEYLQGLAVQESEDYEEI